MQHFGITGDNSLPPKRLSPSWGPLGSGGVFTVDPRGWLDVYVLTLDNECALSYGATMGT